MDNVQDRKSVIFFREGGVDPHALEGNACFLKTICICCACMGCLSLQGVLP